MSENDPSQLKMKLFVLSACFLVMLSCSASALQASYMYVSLSYGRGWWPWACVTEMGVKNACGCESSSESPSGTLPDRCSESYGTCALNFCGARICPFESAAMSGFTCLQNQECDVYGNNESAYAECYLRSLNTSDSSAVIPLDPSAWGLVVKITIPEDFKLVSSDGLVLGDEICVGESFKVSKGVNKGEYWSDGGHMDSPPIYWVDDVESVVQKLMDYHEKTLTKEKDIHTKQDIPEGFVDDLTHIPIHYDASAGLFGNLLCSMKSNDDTKGADSELDSRKDFRQRGEYYVAASKKDAVFNANYSVECMYYYYGGQNPYYNTEDGTYYNTYIIRVPTVLQAGPNATTEDWGTQNIVFNSKEDFFKVGSIGINRKIRVVDPPIVNVSVSIAGADVIKFGESNTFRVLVKNTGDMNISLRSVNSRPVGKLISCDANVLKPSETGECLLSVTPQTGDGVSVQVSYDYKSCGRSQVGLETKTLIASKVLEPVLSEQVYSMGVHGGCENSYYACNEAKTQPSFFAGYKCYKTSSGFYTPTTERFNLKFDLSSLPKNLDISSVRLNLYSSAVGKSQSVSVYSVDKDWKAVQCVPGGDICTRPYCSECAPVYDLGGVLQSSSQVSTPNRYSFDVTGLIKDKYSKGDSSVSLQVRGVEGLWESMGQSGCSVDNNWEKLDVSFDSVTGNGPYLEIVYKQ